MSAKIYPVLKSAKARTLIDNERYQKWYQESVEDPEKFWDKHGRRIDWFKPYTKVKNTSFKGRVPIKWFEDGLTNVSYNCIDRHLKTHGERTAIIWEGDNPYIDKKITYNQLYDYVCRLANVLKKHGVKKGDRVTIYMPMIPEAAYAMLACARIGAIHSVVFGGFSPEALAAASLTASPPSSSPAMRACAAASLSRSRKIPTRRSISPPSNMSSSTRFWWCAAPAARPAGRRAATSGTIRKSPP
ncbi:Acetyl-coenzyme A synthetase (Acetate--CoA ligase) (Acyl-activating enzyme) [Agrobacterium tumefaciens]|nr:Acetyl-coenzyme A synthetase (Acetate--CoA ligase) (Acyl-activating enzyme) [Agrobacterium tumefaciens]